MKKDILFSSQNDEWSTPQDMFDSLDDEFHFTLDPCATKENHKCDWYYTKEQNGLTKDWCGHRVFCNPPLQRHSKVGRKMLSRRMQRQHFGLLADSFPDGHKILPQLYLQQIGDTIHKRTIKVQRDDSKCSLSVYGRYIPGSLYMKGEPNGQSKKGNDKQRIV